MAGREGGAPLATPRARTLAAHPALLEIDEPVELLGGQVGVAAGHGYGADRGHTGRGVEEAASAAAWRG